MWQCKICGYKNNNSSKICHGEKCNGKREAEAFELPIQIVKKEKVVKKIYDFCPACGKDMFFTPARWKGKKGYWRCESGKHRPCTFSGKSKPFPVSESIPEVKVI